MENNNDDDKNHCMKFGGALSQGYESPIFRALKERPKDTHIQILFDELWAEWKETPIEVTQQIEDCCGDKSKYIIATTPLINEHYRFQHKITEDMEGKLECYTHRKMEKPFMVRVIYKDQLFSSTVSLFEAIRKEIWILQTCGFLELENIGEIYQVYEDEKNIYLIFKWCYQCDLEFALQNFGRSYDEHILRMWMKHFCEILFMFHRAKIAHGDIKLTTIFLKEKTLKLLEDAAITTAASSVTCGAEIAQSPMYIVNLGFVKQIYRTHKKTVCPFRKMDWLYYAPETLKGPQLQVTLESDMWSLGVILYMMSYGYPPFLSFKENEENFRKEMKEIILKGFQPIYHKEKGPYFYVPEDPYLDDDYCSNSLEICDLIENLLIVDPLKRYTIEKIHEHPFMLPFATNEQKAYYLSSSAYALSQVSTFTREFLNYLKETKLMKEGMEMYFKGYGSLFTYYGEETDDTNITTPIVATPVSDKKKKKVRKKVKIKKKKEVQILTETETRLLKIRFEEKKQLENEKKRLQIEIPHNQIQENVKSMYPKLSHQQIDQCISKIAREKEQIKLHTLIEFKAYQQHCIKLADRLKLFFDDFIENKVIKKENEKKRNHSTTLNKEYFIKACEELFFGVLNSKGVEIFVTSYIAYHKPSQDGRIDYTYLVQIIREIKDNDYKG